ncbi:hypothetical protein N7495_000752 [Penicillium taxi]|uniref:uncharacterized protein n=1 Tax=Penicillium taxi TaxID=168475 RepID=UPI00254508DE|nr:uncharacterized protein N7495_000752 [Penicillium taxi]KAJ5908070.1 hypothetical protein N7495_000752 [Penicillium taxi]
MECHSSFKDITVIVSARITSKSGRPRKACDNCAKERITCDGSHPCSACQSHGVHCTRQRLANHDHPEPAQLLSNVPGLSTGKQSICSALQSDEQDQDKVRSVPFLLNFSRSGNRNLGDVNQVLSQLSAAESPDENSNSALPSHEIEADRADLFFEESWEIFFGSYKNDAQTRGSPLARGLEDPDQRQMAAIQMIDCITGICHDCKRAEYTLDADRIREFFSEDAVYNFIEAYFERTVRPRSRIVLKPYFDLATISTSLLLSIFLMGAICGTSDSTIQALEYAEMAERVVFESPVLQALMHRKQDDVESLQESEMELIQAAILIILIQISSPNTETRHRTRIQRYPALVSVARATRLTQIKNNWQKNDKLSYKEFLKNETCIRFVLSSE